MMTNKNEMGFNELNQVNGGVILAHYDKASGKVTYDVCLDDSDQAIIFRCEGPKEDIFDLSDKAVKIAKYNCVSEKIITV